MPVITFIRDVTLENERGGPHYRTGYCVDVGEGFAVAQVRAGNAVYGVIKQAAEPAVEIPSVPRRKRVRLFE